MPATPENITTFLDRWDARYDAEGSTCPFPDQLLEEEFSYLFTEQEAIDFWEAAFKRNAADFDHDYATDEDFIDDFQGYHEEWPPILAAARALLAEGLL